MKKSLLFICFFSILAFATYAQTMHVVMVINTNEAGRSVDRTADYENMKRFWVDAARQAEVKLSMTHLGTNEFYSSNVLKTCNSLQVSSKDIVIFYYSGHGANDRSSTWPILDFKDKTLRMSDVVKTLRAKNPKFLMVMSDCCNSYMNCNRIPPVQSNPASSALYKDLFLNFKGRKQILVSASMPGEHSYSDMTHGSIWGLCFRESFRRATDNSNMRADWHKIFEDGKKMAGQTSQSKQTAQFEIIIQSDASEED